MQYSGVRGADGHRPSMSTRVYKRSTMRAGAAAKKFRERSLHVHAIEEQFSDANVVVAPLLTDPDSLQAQLMEEHTATSTYLGPALCDIAFAATTVEDSNDADAASLQLLDPA